MKKFILLVSLVTLMLGPTAIFAQGNAAISTRQAIYEAIRANTYDNLVKSTYCSLSDIEHVAPNDITSTGTASVSYAGSFSGPLLLRVQNLGTTAKIHFKDYSTSTVGLASTVATDPFLESKHGNYLATNTYGQLAPGECWEKIYYDTPDLIFGGIEAATFSIQIFTRSN